jgi:hypothetical protein
MSCVCSLHPSKLQNHGIITKEMEALCFIFPSSVIIFKLHDAQDLLVMYKGIPGHIAPSYRLAKCLEGCMAIIVKSFFYYTLLFSSIYLGPPMRECGLVLL